MVTSAKNLVDKNGCLEALADGGDRFDEEYAEGPSARPLVLLTHRAIDSMHMVKQAKQSLIATQSNVASLIGLTMVTSHSIAYIYCSAGLCHLLACQEFI